MFHAPSTRGVLFYRCRVIKLTFPSSLPWHGYATSFTDRRDLSTDTNPPKDFSEACIYVQTFRLFTYIYSS